MLGSLALTVKPLHEAPPGAQHPVVTARQIALLTSSCCSVTAAELSLQQRSPTISARRAAQPTGTSKVSRRTDFWRTISTASGWVRRFWRLARLARQGFGLSEIALPVMRELVATTNETVLLTRRHHDRVVTLERVEPAGTTIRLSYERGQVLPIHAGASAKVLIAFADDAEVDRILAAVPLQRFTSNTVTDPARLRVELAEIRASGFARSYGELDEGVVGIGAPILQREMSSPDSASPPCSSVPQRPTFRG